ncbi:nuclear transport factor 2 family protein [Mucilaginibacter puniceus]
MIKKILYLFSLLVILNITAKAQTADEKAVAEAGNQLNQGLINRDIKLLDDLVLPELSYGHSSGNVETKAAFLEAVAKGPVRYLAINISNQTIQVTGDNAVTRHTQDLDLVNNGTPTKLKIGNMLIWKKINNKWKLLAKQGFKL